MSTPTAPTAPIAPPPASVPMHLPHPDYLPGVLSMLRDLWHLGKQVEADSEVYRWWSANLPAILRALSAAEVATVLHGEGDR